MHHEFNSNFRELGTIPEIRHIIRPNISGITSDAFAVPTIREGDLVPIGPSHAVEADFSAFEWGDLSEKYKQFAENFWGNVLTKTSFSHNRFLKLPMEDQFRFATALFAAELARDFFTLELLKISSEYQQIARYLIDWKHFNEEKGTILSKRKLSESGRFGACSEISIFTKEVMKRVGSVDVEYATGYRSTFASQPQEYHAFLTTTDGKVIIDPTLTITSEVDVMPEGLFIAEKDTTFLNNPAGAYYNSIDGGYFYYASLEK